jgi:Flp pilus assembly pilin Flp
MVRQLLNDEAGFIVSAELVLVATLLVIGLIVGLSEVQHAVVQELNDVADAIGEVNQSYSYTGFSAEKTSDVLVGATKSVTYGSSFLDVTDDCDDNQCSLACDAPALEGPKLQ